MTPAEESLLEGLDPVIHPAKRLAAMAILSIAIEVDFPFMKERLGLNDSDLSKQMTTLSDAGYIRITKTGRGRGATTTYRITDSGHSAYKKHRAALQALIASE